MHLIGRFTENQIVRLPNWCLLFFIFFDICLGQNVNFIIQVKLAQDLISRRVHRLIVKSMGLLADLVNFWLRKYHTSRTWQNPYLVVNYATQCKYSSIKVVGRHLFDNLARILPSTTDTPINLKFWPIHQVCGQTSIVPNTLVI